MDWAEKINAVVDYIEENLTGQISYDVVAALAGCSIYNFQRMFSYIAGQSLSDYIRARRLTMAAFDIVNGKERLLDIALRYGYDSGDSFARAFQRHHGLQPSRARNQGALLRSCPRISFHITIKGGDSVQYQIEQWPAFTVTGYKTMVRTDQAFQVIPGLWDQAQRDGTIAGLIELWKACDSRPAGLLGVAVGGSWGGSEETAYYRGVTSHVDVPEAKRVPAPAGMEELGIPAATWAILPCEGALPDSVQNVYKAFYTEWLPSSGYKLADVPVVECYFPDRQEVWIGVEAAESSQ